MQNYRNIDENLREDPAWWEDLLADPLSEALDYYEQIHCEDN